MEPTIKIAPVGVGMFGGDVHLRACADLQRFGSDGITIVDPNRAGEGADRVFLRLYGRAI
jgi:predicted dehydrogenase